MTKLFADKEIFDLMHGRTAKWIRHDWPGCDPIMKPLVIGFHTFPGITPVFCCEGHIGHKTWDGFYIMLAVTEAGFGRLQRIFTSLMTKILKQADHANRDAVRPNSLGMTFTQRCAPVDVREYWTPVVNLHITLHNETQKETFFRLINETLNQAILEMDFEGDTMKPLDIASQSWLLNEFPNMGAEPKDVYPSTFMVRNISKATTQKELDKFAGVLDIDLPSGNASVTFKKPTKEEIAAYVSTDPMKVITSENDLELNAWYCCRLKTKLKSDDIYIARCILETNGDIPPSKILTHGRGFGAIHPPSGDYPGTMQYFHIVGPYSRPEGLHPHLHFARMSRAKEIIDSLD